MSRNFEMPNFAGWQKYLHLARETTWGTFPETPSYLYLPHLRYGVEPRPVAERAALFAGVSQRRHQQTARAALAGPLECPLFSYYSGGESIAETLLEWLLSAPDGGALESFSAVLYEADVDNKQHVGLRPRRGVLSGNAAGGGIRLHLDLEGKAETGGVTPPPLPSSPPTPSACLFKDVTLTTGGVAVSLESFALAVDNQVEVVHNNSFWPSLISAGVREVKLTATVLKSSDAFDALRRSTPDDIAGTLVLKGPHNGTGPGGTNHTLITIDFPRLAFDADGGGGLVAGPRRARPAR